MASSDGRCAAGERGSETGEGQTASSLETLYIPREKCVFSSDLEEEWRKSSKPFHVQVPRKLGVRAAKEMCKRPCSFFLEGHCRRADCKFSHNISGITCRFWEEGSCFKGITCPFLHGYPTEEQLQRGLASSPSTSDNEAMFELELEAREEKGKEDEDVATSDGSGGSSKSDDSSARARYQRVRRKLARISHPRNKVFKSHSKSAPIDIKARK
ncbi:PREDICTED: zinc finger CCCH domain-containing protein 7-like [Priapulus caudatus]|uniref:Zinc finger CCCH domain-containing protein 7-like n=1 Tax=Priapulus caudatus TaxID=37621 RepID=A0ABM1EQH7_PRICU|nr:PREDICTED: zinc finger CCCH domain-containing protein 7-like [Priapulus caudatus]